MYKKIFLLYLFHLSIYFAFSQQIGSWRMHFNTNNTKQIAYSNDKLIAATEKAILLYDLSDFSIRELNKANALSDIGISSIAYNQTEQTFVIAYTNSNIDLISNDLSIRNLPDIKNKITSSSKTIHAIYTFDSFAYLSTDLGVIVLDIANQEIDNTYIIGNSGNPVQVLDCTIFNDTVYAMTNNQGIKRAPLDGVNLLDYSNWAYLGNLPFGTPTTIEMHSNNLYVVLNNNSIYVKNQNAWDLLYQNPQAKIKSLVSSEKLVATLEINDGINPQYFEYLVFNTSTSFDTLVNTRAQAPNEAVFINASEWYIADQSGGLLDANATNYVTISGKPFDNDIYKMESRKSKVFAAPGYLSKNLDAGYNQNGFYFFENNNWTNVNQYNTSNLENISNFVDVKENPITNIVYGATTSGLIAYDYNQITRYDSSNSLLKVQEDGGSSTYVTALDFDAQGNVWMVNSRTKIPLILFTKTGEWYSYPLSFGGNLKYNGLFVDSNNQKWVTLRGKGVSVFPSIEVFDANYNGASISITTGISNIPNDNVNTIAEDKNGSIWFGTDEGIAVFDCPRDIFDQTSDCRTARRIKSTLDLYTEYLFDTDIVNSIKVDGANRKWVGTNSGAYLLSESGDELLLSFNTENSPLPSNEVLSIGINEQTGEVFLGTSLGIASYIGDATEPSETIDDIKAFPNPVGPDYFGTISVTGLVENSFVKITDINGTLIHDGYALGGKFVWDGNDYNGKRAKTGVYLVFSSDNKSKNKAVTKIVFIQ